MLSRPLTRWMVAKSWRGRDSLPPRVDGSLFYELCAGIGGVGIMRRLLWTALTGLALGLLPGCATGPLLENPLSVPGGPVIEGEANPVFVPQGPISYSKVFEHALDVLTDFGFEILESNAYEGRIETLPRVAPGFLQFLKPGNPDAYERLLATLQSYRHRATVMIQPAQ